MHRTGILLLLLMNFLLDTLAVISVDRDIPDQGL